jgi:transcriptional regulator with XRE-family HTH domain
VLLLNTDFPRHIVSLRRKKGISQKQAASDLGISQALLSHYEKGIRECGLDFIVKVSDYYGVSCDYLLRKGSADDDGNSAAVNSSAYAGSDPFKKSIIHVIDIIFAILKKINSRALSKEITNMIYSSTYFAFRMLYDANDKNTDNIFSIGKNVSNSYVLSGMLSSSVKSTEWLAGKNTTDVPGISKDNLPLLSKEQLQLEFPTEYKDLSEMIRTVEKIHK